MVPRWALMLGLLLAGDRAIAAPDARAAVQRALPFLERDGAAWMAGKTPANQGSPRDYIYKYWGTAWAAIGLARALAGG